ncbi:hypothetical protein [Xanthomonas sp. GPE 39]|uniref:hypothetical protein n=1 Tax=Xanthomonas sp. GPE 39 TaxID=1583099 RepID=UPI000B29BD99|nr:hypothetical protein [Xanthomonas sp. GPE 39]
MAIRNSIFNLRQIVLCATFALTTSAATAAGAQQPNLVIYQVQNWRRDVVAIRITNNNSTGCGQVNSYNGNPQHNDTIPLQVGVQTKIEAMSQRDCSDLSKIDRLNSSVSESKPGTIIIRGNQLQVVPRR